MAMKVVVISPLHNIGASAASLFIAQAATFGHYKSLLLYNQQESLLTKYVGELDDGDITRSVSQLAQLLDAGALTSDAIFDYATEITENCYYMNTTSTNLYAEDRLALVQNLYALTTADVTICDNTEDLDADTTQYLIDKSDAVFIAIPHSLKGFDRLKYWLEQKSLSDYKPKLYVLVCKYTEEVFAMRNLSKYIGFSNTHVLRMHYNPWIEKMSFSGKLHTVPQAAWTLDPRVVNLHNDMKEILSCLDSIAGQRPLEDII